MAKYNGHKNYNAWNVSLWLNNDEGYYRCMLDCIRTTNNRREAAEKLLEYLPEMTGDKVKFTLTNCQLAMVGLKQIIILKNM